LTYKRALAEAIIAVRVLFEAMSLR